MPVAVASMDLEGSGDPLDCVPCVSARAATSEDGSAVARKLVVARACRQAVSKFKATNRDESDIAGNCNASNSTSAAVDVP